MTSPRHGGWGRCHSSHTSQKGNRSLQEKTGDLLWPPAWQKSPWNRPILCLFLSCFSFASPNVPSSSCHPKKLPLTLNYLGADMLFARSPFCWTFELFQPTASKPHFCQPRVPQSRGGRDLLTSSWNALSYPTVRSGKWTPVSYTWGSDFQQVCPMRSIPDF